LDRVCRSRISLLKIRAFPRCKPGSRDGVLA
jgi:hypothetical protein